MVIPMTAGDRLVVWLRPDRSAAGPKPQHSRSSIAHAGIGLADNHGVEAVSMRSVAAAAGSGTASLYRYFKSHDELLEVMIDTVSAEYELGQASGSPLVELTELAVQGRAIMHRHPWLPALLLTRPSMGPNSLKYLEYALSVLSNTGISESAKLRTIAMLTAITASHVLNELGSAGTSAADDAATGKYLATIIGSDQYPHLGRALSHAAPVKGLEAAFREAISQHLTGAGLETDPY